MFLIQHVKICCGDPKKVVAKRRMSSSKVQSDQYAMTLHYIELIYNHKHESLGKYSALLEMCKNKYCANIELNINTIHY